MAQYIDRFDIRIVDSLINATAPLANKLLDDLVSYCSNSHFILYFSENKNMFYD